MCTVSGGDMLKWPAMKNKGSVADRLLHLRHGAGGDAHKHAHYHAVVNRYQRVLMRNYLSRYRKQFQSRWQVLKQTPVIRKVAGWKVKIRHQFLKTIL